MVEASGITLGRKYDHDDVGHSIQVNTHDPAYHGKDRYTQYDSNAMPLRPAGPRFMIYMSGGRKYDFNYRDGNNAELERKRDWKKLASSKDNKLTNIGIDLEKTLTEMFTAFATDNELNINLESGEFIVSPVFHTIFNRGRNGIVYTAFYLDFSFNDLNGKVDGFYDDIIKDRANRAAGYKVTPIDKEYHDICLDELEDPSDFNDVANFVKRNYNLNDINDLRKVFGIPMTFDDDIFDDDDKNDILEAIGFVYGMEDDEPDGWYFGDPENPLFVEDDYDWEAAYTAFYKAMPKYDEKRYAKTLRRAASLKSAEEVNADDDIGPAANNILNK